MVPNGDSSGPPRALMGLGYSPSQSNYFPGSQNPLARLSCWPQVARWEGREDAGVEGSIVVQKVREAGGPLGFNAGAEASEDLVTAGTPDPTRAVRTALGNASSIARLMVTTECPVTEVPEKEKKPATPSPPEDY